MANIRGKCRSLAQRIGKKGETIFEQWAVDRRLTANKVSDDYGIDYFCQVTKPLSNGNETLTGALLAVQVKSVDGQGRKRIKLSREDVENIIRIEAPFCLIAINVGSITVHYRFLDEEFLRKLHDFFRSDNKTITFSLDALANNDDLFIHKLSQVTKLSYQHNIQRVKAFLEIAKLFPVESLLLTKEPQETSHLLKWHG